MSDPMRGPTTDTMIDWLVRDAGTDEDGLGYLGSVGVRLLDLERALEHERELADALHAELILARSYVGSLPLELGHVHEDRQRRIDARYKQARA